LLPLPLHLQLRLLYLIPAEHSNTSPFRSHAPSKPNEQIWGIVISKSCKVIAPDEAASHRLLETERNVGSNFRV
jgi:hypothetical protein